MVPKELHQELVTSQRVSILFNSKFPYQTQPKPLANFSNQALLSRVVCQFCQDLWSMKIKEKSNSLEGSITNVQLQTYKLKKRWYIKDKFGAKSHFLKAAAIPVGFEMFQAACIAQVTHL